MDRQLDDLEDPLETTPTIDPELVALHESNPDQIVDLRVSVTGLQEAELARAGYHQLPPQHAGDVTGTFGKGRSIWTWKRGQGTCSGRLKPLTDIQLLNVGVSSAMVLSGYTCCNEPLGSQFLWIKRAASAEEEKDAILDIHVSFGKSKHATDSIWHSPGVGWIRIDGNFSSGGMMDFSKEDAFVWFLPSRTRAPELIVMSPTRSAVVMNDDLRRERIFDRVRSAIRHYVPVSEIRRLALVDNLNSTQEGAVSFQAKKEYLGSVAIYQKVRYILHTTHIRYTILSTHTSYIMCIIYYVYGYVIV